MAVAAAPRCCTATTPYSLLHRNLQAVVEQVDVRSLATVSAPERG